MSTKNGIDVRFRIPLPDGITTRRVARWFWPNPGTLILIGILIWVQLAGAAPWARPALQTGGSSATTINYQGRLANSAGEPINVPVTIQFALYNSDTGGALLWPDSGTEIHADVPVSDGLFSVKLGSETESGIPANILGGDVWLEVTVGGETLMPRERLGAVPYALQALTVADGAITTEMIKDGAVTQEKASFAVRHYVGTNPETNPKVSTGTVVFLLTGGAGTEEKTIDISTIGFNIRPVGIAQVVDGDSLTFVRCTWDGSTATTAKFYFFRPAGGTIPGGPIRVNYVLWSDG